MPTTMQGTCQRGAKISSMDAFVEHSGKIAVLNEDNVDTDRIIPARFLSRVNRLGYGELLFADVRNEGFELEKPEAAGATILVVGSNFGCGSSREHAVWAVQQAGFKALIAKKTEALSGFSDIFRQNSANCGLLLIELGEEAHSALVNAGTGTLVQVDLPSQTVSMSGKAYPFDISLSAKNALLQGLDLIGTTLVHNDDIAKYEAERGPFAPKL